jgi:hypothetical protein
VRKQSRWESYWWLAFFCLSAADGAPIKNAAIEIDVTAANRGHQCCTANRGRSCTSIEANQDESCDMSADSARSILLADDLTRSPSLLHSVTLFGVECSKIRLASIA